MCEVCKRFQISSTKRLNPYQESCPILIAFLPTSRESIPSELFPGPPGACSEECYRVNSQPKSCARYGTGIPGEHRASQLDNVFSDCFLHTNHMKASGQPNMSTMGSMAWTSWEQNEEVVLGYCPTRDVLENERTATDA